MIRQITEQDLAFIGENQKVDPFLCRILSTIHMYGAYSFVDCWVQIQEESECTMAYLSKMDGVLTLFAYTHADFQEISCFIEVVEVRYIMCSTECAAQLGITPDRTGSILKFGNVPVQLHGVEVNPPIQSVYEVLQSCANEIFVPPPFEPFYLDMSHRIRHGGAKITGIMKQGRLIACAMTVAETEQTAVVGGVAVHPVYQRNGFGTRVVYGLLHLCAQQQQKHIYVYCDTNKNKQFYQSLGFLCCGIWAEIECIK